MDSDSESIVESVREQVDTALEKRVCLYKAGRSELRLGKGTPCH